MAVPNIEVIVKVAFGWPASEIVDATKSDYILPLIEIIRGEIGILNGGIEGVEDMCPFYDGTERREVEVVLARSRWLGDTKVLEPKLYHVRDIDTDGAPISKPIVVRAGGIEGQLVEGNGESAVRNFTSRQLNANIIMHQEAIPFSGRYLQAISDYFDKPRR